MKVITCPDRIPSRDVSTLQTYLFIAGGISGCPDWQKEMLLRFKHIDDGLTLINPRRTSFNIEDPAESAFQIEWERLHLDLADGVIFWFPFQTVCPITLFELGVAAADYIPIFVGCHPAYSRKFDVEKQLSLIRPEVVVHDNWEPLVEQVEKWYTDQ
jgi:hypothetical protein